jgi:TonB family protein
MVRWKKFYVKAVIEWEPPPWPARTQGTLRAIPNAPKPTAPTFAFRVIVEKESGGGIFSYEECFVYQAGAYRLIGIGTFPFWVWEAGAEPNLDSHGAFLASPRTFPLSIHTTKATYPEEAQRKGIRGCAIVDVLIGADGKVAEMTPFSGDPLLTKALMEAIRDWEFIPASEDGKYVQSRMRMMNEFGVPSCRTS